jgi:hypothetical protein
MSKRKCVNIHDGTPGIITNIDGEDCVLFNDRRGNVRKALYSPLNWREDKPAPRHFPKTVMLQVAYEADRKLLQVYGLQGKDWLSLHPEEKRAWLEGTANFHDQGEVVGEFRELLHNTIMDTLGPLWKEA